MAVSGRYQPSHPAGQSAVYAVDFSAMLPPGIGLTMPAIQIQTNTVPPGLASGITTSGGGFAGRRVWITITGGTNGQDYLITWTVSDTTGNLWVRTFTLLCARTS